MQPVNSENGPDKMRTLEPGARDLWSSKCTKLLSEYLEPFFELLGLAFVADFMISTEPFSTFCSCRSLDCLTAISCSFLACWNIASISSIGTGFGLFICLLLGKIEQILSTWFLTKKEEKRSFIWKTCYQYIWTLFVTSPSFLSIPSS